jgi:hypothetical protein
MLRIDPAHPPLWRSATCLQFGVDDAARLDEPEPWEERLVDELTRGAAPAAVHAFLRSQGVDASRADAFFAELQPVLVDDPPPARIVVQAADDVSPDDAEAVVTAIARTGADADLQAWAGRSTAVPPSGSTVILLAAHLVEPRRAAVLVGADVRHLPLVLDGAGAVVGPLVEPGRTACLACGDAYARDADPAWPLVASQLIGRRSPVAGSVLAGEAARVAAYLISEPDPAPVRSSVRLRVDSPHRRWQQHPPHAACGCRSLEGIWTAPDRSVPTIVPSSPRAFARPA